MHLSHRCVDAITSEHVSINTYVFTDFDFLVTLEFSILDSKESSRFTTVLVRLRKPKMFVDKTANIRQGVYVVSELDTQKTDICSRG
jgi:hypothetical protein